MNKLSYKISREKIREKSLSFGLGKDFLAYNRKKKIDKWNLIKLKNVSSSKDIIKKMKRQATD